MHSIYNFATSLERLLVDLADIGRKGRHLDREFPIAVQRILKLYLTF